VLSKKKTSKKEPEPSAEAAAESAATALLIAADKGEEIDSMRQQKQREQPNTPKSERRSSSSSGRRPSSKPKRNQAGGTAAASSEEPSTASELHALMRRGTSLDDDRTTDNKSSKTPSPVQQEHKKPTLAKGSPVSAAGAEALEAAASGSAHSEAQTSVEDDASSVPTYATTPPLPEGTTVADLEVACGLGGGGTSNVVLAKLCKTNKPKRTATGSSSRLLLRSSSGSSRFWRFASGTPKRATKQQPVGSSSSKSSNIGGGESRGGYYAVKVVAKARMVRDRQLQRLATERRVLQLCKGHPFVAQLHGAFQNKRQLFFVLDFCHGGDLFTHLKRAPQVGTCALYAEIIYYFHHHLYPYHLPQQLYPVFFPSVGVFDKSFFYPCAPALRLYLRDLDLCFVMGYG